MRDISTIQMGLILARKKADSGSQYSYQRLTLRSMESNYINLNAITPFYSTEPLQNDYLSSTGTIVMKLFAPFNPIVITKETEGFLIPSQMVIIKPGKAILPEYLRLYLSQDFVTKYLLANYYWIAQKAITVDSLLNLEVRIPPPKSQQAICDYYQNHLHLCQLRNDLAKEEQTIMNYIFSLLSRDKGYRHGK